MERPRNNVKISRPPATPYSTQSCPATRASTEEMGTSARRPISGHTSTFRYHHREVQGQVGAKGQRVCIPKKLEAKSWAEKWQRQGLRDVDELKAVYQEKINVQRKPEPTDPYPPVSPAPPSSISQDSRKSNQPAPQSPGSAPPGVKTLSSFVDVAKILDLPQKEIEYIWRLRHAQNPQSLCAVIPQTIYNRIEATARKHPQFILPIPREEKGAEIHFLQWTFPTPTTSTILFTHLAEFKLRGEYAQPHTTVTHHLDVADQKGLVLLQGSVVDGRGISVEEGKWLLMCLQKFYGGEEKVERRKLLEQFSQGDGDFKVEHLLEEAEKIV